MDLTHLFNELSKINQNPSILLQESEENPVYDFLKHWILFAADQVQLNEFSYIWSLVHGWNLDKLSRSLLTTSNLRVEQPEQLYLRPSKQVLSKITLEKVIEKQNMVTFQYISDSEAIIKQDDIVTWINPQNIDLLSEIQSNLVIIITSAHIQRVISYLKLKAKVRGEVKLISTEKVYLKMKKLVDFLNIQGHKYEMGQCYMLKPEMYFEYNRILWMLRQNCWFEPSYDLTVTFTDKKNVKKTFLIADEKLNQTKLIYYGWKKNFLTEQRYQMYIREWDKSIIKPSSNYYHEIYPIEQKIRKGVDDWFLTYIQKDIIKDLEDIERNDILSCCELFEFIPNQTIFKKNYLFDHIFILLDGKFQVEESYDENIKNGTAKMNKLYGLDELLKNEQKYTYTLKSVNAATAFRISKQNVKFILYDVLTDFEKNN